jgi:hypothetical protein
MIVITLSRNEPGMVKGTVVLEAVLAEGGA